MIARVAAIFLTAVLALPAAGTAAVIKAENTAAGRYLTDQSGVSVYLFEQDRPQADGIDETTACVGDCLVLFVPVPADPAPIAGAGVDARLIGSLRRPDGIVQATYNGWPLYYFGEDLAAGDVNGHQINEFGGDWYLVAPSGREFGGRLASGVDYQKSEACGCQDSASNGVGTSGQPAAPAAGTSLTVRFADDFMPANKTAGPAMAMRSLDARGLGRLTNLASAQ